MNELKEDNYLIAIEGKTNDSRPINLRIKQLPYPTGSIECNMIGIIEEFCSEAIETGDILNSRVKDYVEVINFLIKDGTLFNAIKSVKENQRMTND